MEEVKFTRDYVGKPDGVHDIVYTGGKTYPVPSEFVPLLVKDKAIEIKKSNKEAGHGKE